MTWDQNYGGKGNKEVLLKRWDWEYMYFKNICILCKSLEIYTYASRFLLQTSSLGLNILYQSIENVQLESWCRKANQEFICRLSVQKSSIYVHIKCVKQRYQAWLGDVDYLFT